MHAHRYTIGAEGSGGETPDGAARTVIEQLRAFVRETGTRGRFVVFGSAVTGTMRHDSDIDILIDFPREAESAAWRAVEDACRESEIPADILSAATTAEAFLEKVMARPVEVIA